MSVRVGTAVITGASASIGRAAAKALARRGWPVALIARGADGLEGARSEIGAVGARVLPIEADVADAGAVERAADRVVAEVGPIRIWVNKAAVTLFAPLREIPAAE